MSTTVKVGSETRSQPIGDPFEFPTVNSIRSLWQRWVDRYDARNVETMASTIIFFRRNSTANPLFESNLDAICRILSVMAVLSVAVFLSVNEASGDLVFLVFTRSMKKDK